MTRPYISFGFFAALLFSSSQVRPEVPDNPRDYLAGKWHCEMSSGSTSVSGTLRLNKNPDTFSQNLSGTYFGKAFQQWGEGSWWVDGSMVYTRTERGEVNGIGVSGNIEASNRLAHLDDQSMIWESNDGLPLDCRK